jgi:hypothetical protein
LLPGVSAPPRIELRNCSASALDSVGWGERDDSGSVAVIRGPFQVRREQAENKRKVRWIRQMDTFHFSDLAHTLRSPSKKTSIQANLKIIDYYFFIDKNPP